MYRLNKCESNGTLNNSTPNANFDPTTGLATFKHLSFDSIGMYILTAKVKTLNTNDYNFDCISSPIIIKKKTQTINLDDSSAPNIYLTFSGNFTKHQENILNYESMIYNCILVKHNLILERSISLYEGSIKAVLGTSGTTQDYNSLISSLNDSFALNWDKE